MGALNHQAENHLQGLICQVCADLADYSICYLIYGWTNCISEIGGLFVVSVFLVHHFVLVERYDSI